jgi:hypothetical protein
VAIPLLREGISIENAFHLNSRGIASSLTLLAMTGLRVCNYNICNSYDFISSLVISKKTPDPERARQCREGIKNVEGEVVVFPPIPNT